MSSRTSCLPSLKRRWAGLSAEGCRWGCGVVMARLSTQEVQMARNFLFVFLLCSTVYLYFECRLHDNRIQEGPTRYYPPGAAALLEKRQELQRQEQQPPQPDAIQNQLPPKSPFVLPPRISPPPPPSSSLSQIPLRSAPQCAHLIPNSTVQTTLPLPVIFMHVPKSAGTTLAWPVRCVYGQEYQQLFTSASASNLLKSTRALIGHVKFGTHLLFPEKNASYVVWLRDPIQRTISHYYYHLYSPKDRYHLWAKQNTLGNWVNNLTDANNLYTQFISGVYGVPADENAYNLAVYNLKNYFKVVGLVDKWNETLVMFKEYFGWNSIAFPRPTKVNRYKPDVTHHPDLIDQETMKNITNANLWDIKLFEVAKELYEQQTRALGPLFECEVAALRTQTPTSWRDCIIRRAPVVPVRRPPYKPIQRRLDGISPNSLV